MNPNISQETYYYLNATLNQLRDEITYINHNETRVALMEQRDVMKRLIDEHQPNWMDTFLRRKNEDC